MRKLFASLILFCFLLFNISSIFACSMRSPQITLNNSITTCEISPDVGYAKGEISLIFDKDGNFNETHFIEICPNYSIAEQDRNQLINLLKEIKIYPEYGNKYLIQQTDTQYNQLKREIRKTNLNICDCSKKSIIGRIDNWTAYSTETKKTCTSSTACDQPPFFCPDSAYFLSPFSLALGDPFAIGTTILILILIITKIVLAIREHIKLKNTQNTIIQSS